MRTKTLTKGDTKHCNGCNKILPLSMFRPRIKANNTSYGNCSTCERRYDADRRRKKGIKPTYQQIEPLPATIKPRVTKERLLMRQARLRPVDRHQSKNCLECSALFLGYQHNKFCTVKCRRRHFSRISRIKRKAKIRLVRVENVNPMVVFEHFQWTCICCGVHTPRHLKGKHEPNSPELDHIIPLSKGGEHSYANTQLLCRSCNAAKSDKIKT